MQLLVVPIERFYLLVSKWQQIPFLVLFQGDMLLKDEVLDKWWDMYELLQLLSVRHRQFNVDAIMLKE